MHSQDRLLHGALRLADVHLYRQLFRLRAIEPRQRHQIP